ncbi:DUF4295 family protein [Balneola vulgaris]|jgi:hypothetical protein|uniref:DUF4295 family protein n=1 Tax=Balneola vulgaris TaxID=287535 RepID=UPI000382E448|nr:DUF4295 family protein [Balneola vulgaris]
MAKKQTFGSDALAAKAAARKMAKVIISTKNESGKYSYRETMIDQENVQDFIKSRKA